MGVRKCIFAVAPAGVLAGVLMNQPIFAMISGPSSYLGTIDDFVAHWTSVNADALAGGGLVTRSGEGLPELLALRAALETATNEVEAMLNGKEMARARVENGKRDLLARGQELGRRLRGLMEVDSPFLAALPEMPQQSAGQELFLRPMRDCSNIWTRIAADGVTVTLSGGFGLNGFNSLLLTLGTRYTELSAAESDLKIAREVRNKLQGDVRELLSGYRPAVEGLFPPDSALVVSIPLIYAQSGRTPVPVVASASYDAAAQEAVVTFSESADAALDRYELRGVPGPVYEGEDEVDGLQCLHNLWFNFGFRVQETKNGGTGEGAAVLGMGVGFSGIRRAGCRRRCGSG
jgi:hypothetical protein